MFHQLNSPAFQRRNLQVAGVHGNRDRVNVIPASVEIENTVESWENRLLITEELSKHGVSTCRVSTSEVAIAVSRAMIKRFSRITTTCYQDPVGPNESWVIRLASY